MRYEVEGLRGEETEKEGGQIHEPTVGKTKKSRGDEMSKHFEFEQMEYHSSFLDSLLPTNTACLQLCTLVRGTSDMTTDMLRAKKQLKISGDAPFVLADRRPQSLESVHLRLGKKDLTCSTDDG